jgi:hypothetical protein
MPINMWEVVMPYLVAWLLGVPALVLLVIWLFVH